LYLYIYLAPALSICNWLIKYSSGHISVHIIKQLVDLRDVDVDAVVELGDDDDVQPPPLSTLKAL
jgi:hypothetical protein